MLQKSRRGGEIREFFRVDQFPPIEARDGVGTVVLALALLVVNLAAIFHHFLTA